MTERQFFIGIDLGGTEIKAGLVDRSGHLLAKLSCSTEADCGVERVIDNMVRSVNQLLQENRVTWSQMVGVGAGIPGFMEASSGVVRLAPNLGFRNLSIGAMLEARLPVPVILDNDANVAALGEAWSGAAANIAELVFITLGTGVGGGIIQNGMITRGAYGVAGEIGHLSIDVSAEARRCGCGRKGCLETLASATAIVTSAREMIAAGHSSSLTDLTNGEITAKAVLQAADAGDDMANAVVGQAAEALGRAMSILSVILNPSCFVIGGGVSKAGETLLTPVRDAYQRYTPQESATNVEILIAQLGNDAGMIGAAALLLPLAEEECHETN